MSVQIRSPPTPSSSPHPSSAHDLKQRVIACLNKLSDRDTLALASAELESIARNLTHDSFSPFLQCLHNTDSSCKSPVRKQCVALLSLLSRSHGDSLSPHLSKMVSTVLRRIRDPDSSVRAACAAAAADMSVHITHQPFSAVSLPLIETLIQDRDANAQIGAAMCLAAAVEAAPDPETEQLRKALPKMGKLLKSEGFKAKAALLGAIGSVISAGGAGTNAVLDWLVPCVTEFLGSEDWAARKAAAEALGRVAMADEELAPQYKKACLAALDSKRFDKVKIVRETMNRTLEVWKDVPGDSEEVSSSASPSRSSTDDGSIGCFPSVARSSSTDLGFKTPRPKKAVPTIKRSPSIPSNKSCVTTGQKENPSKSNEGNSKTFGTPKMENKGPQSLSLNLPLEDHHNDNHRGGVESREMGKCTPEINCVISSKSRNEKVHKISGVRSGSRVVPCNDEGSSDDAVAKIGTEEVGETKKDSEDLSLIREQLAQIENQQFNLLNLLQKFIGSSQSGIQSLESRVNGLEMALDEISHDLAVSSGRIPKRSCSGDSCCKLPGTEFLSPKFWRKTEGRSYCSKFSSSMHNQSVNTVFHTPANDAHADTNKPEQTDVCGNHSGNLGFSNRISKNHSQDSRSIQACNTGRLEGVSSATCTASQSLNSRNNFG